MEFVISDLSIENNAIFYIDVSLFCIVAVLFTKCVSLIKSIPYKREIYPRKS